MEGGNHLFASFIFFLLIQGLVAQYEVQVNPRYVVVNPGDDIDLMCKLNGRLELCLFKFAGVGVIMKPNREKDNVKYQGAGWEKGECGVHIRNVNEKHNGNITCSLVLDSPDGTEKSGNIQVVVAFKPQKPELEVSVGTENRRDNTYKEKDVLTATCTVRDGRPVANISWFLGDDMITEGLRMPVETCTPQNRELCTIQQNLTRTLQSTDDKKTLKCVANHVSLRGEPMVAEYRINVNYPPKQPEHPIEHFGLEEGAEGRIPLVIEANPKPVITWTIGGETIYENTRNGRYFVQPTTPKGPGEYETALIIDNLTKDDTDKDYKVIAHNDLGEAQYSVSISTSPGPKVLEMGAGLIIIIVVAVLLILLILGGVFYARAKGKFCFAGSGFPRIPGESSDTESAEHAEHRPKLTFVSIFRKRDKVATDKEMLRNVTVDDEKSQGTEVSEAGREDGQEQQDAEQVAERPREGQEEGEGVVYAELDLGARAAHPPVMVRREDDKTEYAEIIHTQPSSK